MNRRSLFVVVTVVLSVALALVLGMLFAGDTLFGSKTPGTRLVYTVQGRDGKTSSDLSDDIADALTTHFDPYGFDGIVFNGFEGNKLEVRIPADVPLDELKQSLGIGGVLSFHVVVPPTSPAAEAMVERLAAGVAGPDKQPDDVMRWLPVHSTGDLVNLSINFQNQRYVLVHITPGLAMTHDDPAQPWSLKEAKPMHGESGEAMIGFELDDAGGQLFGVLTQANIGQSIAIVLNDVVISAPLVNDKITRFGVISGGSNGFAYGELRQFVRMLNVGALPGTLSHDPTVEEPIEMHRPMDRRLKFVLKASAVAIGVVVFISAILAIRSKRHTPETAR